MEEPEITIKLTRDEATILSDWLERLQMTDLSNTVDDFTLTTVAEHFGLWPAGVDG
ncbi:hypothetical protein [Streptomyces sp. NPDC058718]|uniref:hypothetical protein n=1 Tax=Streptomyces sp. NPDC058718 TaxID=3346610 RepID=UPI0036BBE3F0